MEVLGAISSCGSFDSMGRVRLTGLALVNSSNYSLVSTRSSSLSIARRSFSTIQSPSRNFSPSRLASALSLALDIKFCMGRYPCVIQPSLMNRSGVCRQPDCSNFFSRFIGFERMRLSLWSSNMRWTIVLEYRMTPFVSTIRVRCNSLKSRSRHHNATTGSTTRQ